MISQPRLAARTAMEGLVQHDDEDQVLVSCNLLHTYERTLREEPEFNVEQAQVRDSRTNDVAEVKRASRRASKAAAKIAALLAENAAMKIKAAKAAAGDSSKGKENKHHGQDVPIKDAGHGKDSGKKTDDLKLPEAQIEAAKAWEESTENRMGKEEGTEMDETESVLHSNENPNVTDVKEEISIDKVEFSHAPNTQEIIHKEQTSSEVTEINQKSSGDSLMAPEVQTVEAEVVEKPVDEKLPLLNEAEVKAIDEVLQIAPELESSKPPTHPEQLPQQAEIPSHQITHGADASVDQIHFKETAADDIAGKKAEPEDSKLHDDLHGKKHDVITEEPAHKLAVDAAAMQLETAAVLLPSATVEASVTEQQTPVTVVVKPDGIIIDSVGTKQTADGLTSDRLNGTFALSDKDQSQDANVIKGSHILNLKEEAEFCAYDAHRKLCAIVWSLSNCFQTSPMCVDSNTPSIRKITQDSISKDPTKIATVSKTEIAPTHIKIDNRQAIAAPNNGIEKNEPQTSEPIKTGEPAPREANSSAVEGQSEAIKSQTQLAASEQAKTVPSQAQEITNQTKVASQQTTIVSLQDQVVAPHAVAHQAVVPQAVAPHAVEAQSVAPQAVAPQAVASETASEEPQTVPHQVQTALHDAQIVQQSAKTVPPQVHLNQELKVQTTPSQNKASSSPIDPVKLKPESQSTLTQKKPPMSQVKSQSPKDQSPKQDHKYHVISPKPQTAGPHPEAILSQSNNLHPQTQVIQLPVKPSSKINFSQVKETQAHPHSDSLQPRTHPQSLHSSTLEQKSKADHPSPDSTVRGRRPQLPKTGNSQVFSSPQGKKSLQPQLPVSQESQQHDRGIKRAQKLEELELAVLKLENRLLRESFAKISTETTLVRLENIVLTLENRLIQHNQTLVESRTNFEQLRKKQELSEVQLSRLMIERNDTKVSNVTRVFNASEVINGTFVSDHLKNLTDLAHNQSLKITQMDILVKRLETENRQMAERLQNQSTTFNDVMRQLNVTNQERVAQKQELERVASLCSESELKI